MTLANLNPTDKTTSVSEQPAAVRHAMQRIDELADQLKTMAFAAAASSESFD